MLRNSLHPKGSIKTKVKKKKTSIEQTEIPSSDFITEQGEVFSWPMEKEKSGSLGWKAQNPTSYFFAKGGMPSQQSRKQVTEFPTLKKLISWLRSDILIGMNTFSFKKKNQT